MTRNLNIKALILKVKFTPTNFLLCLTDQEGRVLFWTSLGMWKVNGAKKATSTTVETSLKKIIQKIIQTNYKNVHLEMKGFNKSKKLFMRSFKNNFINILSISDNTASPHNGCRQKKVRRI